MMKALTNIVHGSGEDRVEIQAGQEVSGLPDDVVRELQASGAVEKREGQYDHLYPTPAEEEEQPQEQVPNPPQSPGQAAEEMMRQSAVDAGRVSEEDSHPQEASTTEPELYDEEPVE